MAMRSVYPPTIDFSHPERAQTHQAIDIACREWGLFQIAGHGIDARLIAAVQRQMRTFFAQPLATKRAISRTAENPWGFFDSELTRNARDWKEIYDFGPADGEGAVPQWPLGLPAFKPVMREYYDACDALALRLLRVIARNLGVPPDYLDANFRPLHTSFLRLNYYPPCPSPERPEDLSLPGAGFLGVNHHTDSGAVTVLLQDEQPGLEVFQRGTWWPVQPRSDTLVVNIGDIVQVWSNNRYMAPLHRGLANAAEQRFSAPFFFNPAYSVEYAPLPSTTDAGNPPRYRPISWREFRARRAAGDYASRDQYHQISHYAV
jgi:isopenicillin N synthase-like dioxygenase